MKSALLGWTFCLWAHLAHAGPSKVDEVNRKLVGEYARQAEAFAETPRALASLAQLHALRDQVDDLNLLAQVYTPLMAKETAHPLVKNSARMLAADLERARGHLTKAKSLLAPLGFVQSFYVLGGFDNEGKRGCDTAHIPQNIKDFSTLWPGKNGEVTWQKLPVASLDGYVDLAAAVRPNRESVAYALTFLEARDEATVRLSVGASGAFRLYVNGQLVSQDSRYKLARVDQHLVDVTLRKGPNPVLLKVCQENGPWGFFLRQETLSGSRVKELLPSRWPGIPSGAPPNPRPQPSASAWLAEEVKKAPDDAQLRSDHALVLAWTQDFETREHTDAVTAARAAAKAPRDARLWLRAALLQKEDLNLRRKYLDAALAGQPRLPQAVVEKALLELQFNHPERALAPLENLLRAHPTYTPAHLAYFRTLDMLGDSARVITLVEEAVLNQEHQPFLVREATRSAQRLQRTEETIRKARLSLALRYDDLEARRLLASVLSEQGQLEESIAQRQTLLALDPFDNETRVRLGELYAANGRLEEAKATFAKARALSFYDAELHEREGRALLQAGRSTEAIELLARALTLRPQNPPLKDLLRELRGESAALGTPYVLNTRSLEKEADEAYSKEDAAYLVDYAYVHVQPSGQASRFHQLGVKVYTQRGADSFRRLPVSYSPSRQDVRVVKARIRKPDGTVIDGYSESERNMNEPWTGMYYDARSRVFSFPALAEGDVLEFQYRLEDTALENLLSDYFGDVESIQSTFPKLRYQYFVDMPASRPLYWSASKLGSSVAMEKQTLADSRTLYRFTAQRVPKVSPEPLMPGWAEVTTTLHVSTYQNWEEVGRYYWGLVRDQLIPDDEVKATVARVLKGIDRKNERAVIEAIYQFVVTQTRYVALEFGIHGYKPYRVDRVLSRRFGDCKDKASLMHAMLKLAGIDSRLVLLRMRNLGAIGGEPASLAAFNHAIAYVPKHRLYLDGTAEFHATSELPTADRAADVLWVEPDGKSLFTTTPEATAKDNSSVLSLQVALKADGSAEVKGSNGVQGQEAPGIRRTYQSVASRKQNFEQAWAQVFPGLSVLDLQLSELTRLEEPVQTRFTLQVPRFSEAQEQLLRFYPFAGRRTLTEALAPLPSRTFDLVLPNPWSNRLQVDYALPEGFGLAELPAPVRESSAFGELSMRFEKDGTRLTAHATLSLDVARVSARDYPAFRAWLLKVDEAFNRRLVARPQKTASH